MKYLKKLIIAGKWIIIVSIVILMILGATVLKHHIDIQKRNDLTNSELEKISVCDGKLPKD